MGTTRYIAFVQCTI